MSFKVKRRFCLYKDNEISYPDYSFYKYISFSKYSEFFMFSSLVSYSRVLMITLLYIKQEKDKYGYSWKIL